MTLSTRLGDLRSTMYLHFQQLLLVKSKINSIYNLPLEISIYKNPSLLVLSSEVPKYLDIANTKRPAPNSPPPPTHQQLGMKLLSS